MPASDPSTIVLDGGLLLSDWVVLAEERLAKGEYLAVLVEGSEHVRVHGEHASVASVVARAYEGYLKTELAKVPVTDEVTARAALEGVEQTRMVLGEGAELAAAELAALEAKAHEMLGDAAQAEAAYRTWLRAAPADHPERRRMLLALHRVQRGEVRRPEMAEGRAAEAREKREKDDRAFARAEATNTVASYTSYLTQFPNGRHVVEARRLREVAREEAERRKAEAPAEVERALGLTHEQRRLVQYGLVSKGYEIGGVDGVLGRRSRAAIRSYQGREGLARTGYLTAELSRALQALGKEYVKGRRMVDIDGGCFQMGSPEWGPEKEERDDDERRHRVCVDDFRMGKHEVTRGEYARFVRATGRGDGDGCWTREDGEWKKRSGRSWRSPGYGQTDAHPVVCVSWGDANAYARWLSEETGERYRLPTEAEWEYAARAGTTTSRYWGDAPDDACGYANVADRTAKETYSDWTIHECRDGYVHTAPVGSKEEGANGYGLYDILGNVWEWTCSEFDADYGGAEKGCATGSSGLRVRRGGSWSSKPWGVRSAYRTRSDAGYRYSHLGFRLAQD